MKEPTLKNIIVLGKFSDGKVRQFLCNKFQQEGIIRVIISLDQDNTLKVIDKEVEGIEWKSDIDLAKILKENRLKN